MLSKPLDLNTFAASTLSSFNPLRNLASKEASIVGAAMDNSAACCTVHLPVPFMPVLSRTLSTKYPSPLSSLIPNMSAVISMRKLRSSPLFHSENTLCSSSFDSFPIVFSTS
ncbi:hypothetical protein V8G54_012218 [Vigna mungo]|uniref:Uncharacterized protein n=1 Tax=Vigna mungo TaxID=3915 RepID=A0AAQ3NT34_VIGMU